MAARSIGVTSLAYIELEDFNDLNCGIKNGLG